MNLGVHIRFTLEMFPKGQLISKQNCRVVTSPKKRMKRSQDFVGEVTTRMKRTQATILSVFRSSIGRSYGSIILFRDPLSFRMIFV